MNNNPFVNLNNNPYIQNSMRTPQQVQEDMNKQLQQYQSAYNQAMNNQNQMNINNFSQRGFFGWKYSEGENEINNIQVPTNGDPFMLVGNGVFWIKKFINGQTYVTTYSFAPVVNNGEPPKNDFSFKDDINAQPNDKNEFKAILESLEQRLIKIEKKVGNSYGKYNSNYKSNQKSSTSAEPNVEQT